jgi:hypothetical protein
MLAEMGIGDLLRVRLHVGGGKESALHFELRDQNGDIEVLEGKADVDLLERMAEKLGKMATAKIKAALRMSRSFHLVD